MLRKKKSYNVKNFADEKYVLALRDRTIEDEKYNEYAKKLDLVSRHLREEELKWQKSEVRAFDKKHLSFQEEKLEELEPYETLEFDTLADVIALGTAQLNLQRVLAIQSQVMGVYEQGIDILDSCLEAANEEKSCLTKSFMASINDSPYLLNTKRNFDNKVKHDQLKQKLSEVVITVSEFKEKIAEHSKALKDEKSILDEERKILFNREVITDPASIDRLKPIYQQVGHEDTKLNEHLVVYNNHEKIRLQKERAIEEKSVERLALEFRAIYGGVTAVAGTTSSHSTNMTVASHASSHTTTTNGTTSTNSSAPPPPLSSPAGPGPNTATSVNPYGTDAADFEYLSEAIAIYEKEHLDYQELIKYYEIQEKSLSEAVKHAKSEIKYLREGRVLKSYSYYDEIAKQWSDTNKDIEKVRKNIQNLITNINVQDKKINNDSTNMLKSFKSVTEGLPNKRGIYRFLHSESYQTLLQTVKQPIQKAKELHIQRNEETNKYTKNKQEKEKIIEELLHNRDEVMDNIHQAKKVYHKYTKSLESYENTIQALDEGKNLGIEKLTNAKQLLQWLEEEQNQLLTIQSLQKEEAYYTQESIQKIDQLEERIDIEKHQITYHTSFGNIILGGGNGNIEELIPLRQILRDKNQLNQRTLRVQQIIDSRSRLHLFNNHKLFKLLCKQDKLYFQDGRDISSDEYVDIVPERKCVTKTKVVYQLEENIDIHSQIHLEKARRVLPYSHSSAYALVFLPYRGKISQSITAPIPVMTSNPSLTTTIPIAEERVVRRKSTSIEPGIVSKMKRTHSRLARKGSMKNMYDDGDDHSESGLTVGSGSTLGNLLASSSQLSNQSDYSKEITSIEAALQKLYRYEQDLISDNMKVMTDVSNLLQTPAGKRLLENKEEKWIQKAFFPDSDFESIIGKFELLSRFPELAPKSAFYVDYHREEEATGQGTNKVENSNVVGK